MLRYYLPVLAIILSNTLYNVCAKSVPERTDPFFSLLVTYGVGAACSLALFFLTSPEKSLVIQSRTLNWAPIVLGVAIVGLEFGYILLYRAGWNISIGSLVCNIGLAVVLVVVGLLLYHETLGAQQWIGIALCIGGLVFINR